MKLSSIGSFILHMREIIMLGLGPTLRAIFRDPRLLIRNGAISRVFLANVWKVMGDGMDGNVKGIKRDLISLNAYGTVLEIGAGYGHSARYLDPEKVSRYIAVEPNELMHEFIREKAHEMGFYESDGRLMILNCGAEDSTTILRSLSPAGIPINSTSTSSPNLNVPLTGGGVNTIISILTLCTVPNPERTLSKLIRDILNTGGQLLMLEHVLNPQPDVAWWQKFWAPIWAVLFDGCRMDRPTDVWVSELKGEVDGNMGSAWREGSMWRPEDDPDEDNLFFTRVGRFIKK